MYDAESNTQAKANTSNLAEDLGQVILHTHITNMK